MKKKYSIINEYYNSINDFAKSIFDNEQKNSEIGLAIFNNNQYFVKQTHYLKKKKFDKIILYENS